MRLYYPYFLLEFFGLKNGLTFWTVVARFSHRNVSFRSLRVCTVQRMLSLAQGNSGSIPGSSCNSLSLARKDP